MSYLPGAWELYRLCSGLRRMSGLSQSWNLSICLVPVKSFGGTRWGRKAPEKWLFESLRSLPGTEFIAIHSPRYEVCIEGLFDFFEIASLGHHLCH